MDGESAGLNLHTRQVNREPSDGLLASFTVTLKEIKVTFFIECFVALHVV